MHDKDFLSFQRQSGLQAAPQNVIDEYERRTNMLCRDAVPLPLGPLAMNEILRHCGIEGPAALRPAQMDVVDWARVAPESRIIVAREPNKPIGGRLIRFKNNGCLDVWLDGDTAVREYAQRHVSLDVHYSDDPWSEVPIGRLVSVLRGKREFDAEYIGIVDQEQVRVRFKSGEQVVPKADVKLEQVA